jgi:beta-phosphoglucomutase-like phosphatase (HAD superfamily)
MVRRARLVDQQAILSAALARARGARRGVAVFDLDSTIIDNRPRQVRILQEYGRAVGLPALAAAGPEVLDGWSLERALRRAGVPESRVGIEGERLRRFWEERFFTDALCRLDVAMPGASAFVRAVRDAQVRIAYVTGRPMKMEDGTREVLARFGFPLPDDETTWLFMKPGEALGDDAWKAIARDAVDALGEVVLAFDNEPAHVNAYARAWRRAVVVHLDTDHSERAIAVDAAIPSVADFAMEPEPSAFSAGAEGATARGR